MSRRRYRNPRCGHGACAAESIETNRCGAMFVIKKIPRALLKAKWSDVEKLVASRLSADGFRPVKVHRAEMRYVTTAGPVGVAIAVVPVCAAHRMAKP